MNSPLNEDTLPAETPAPGDSAPAVRISVPDAVDATDPAGAEELPADMLSSRDAAPAGQAAVTEAAGTTKTRAALRELHDAVVAELDKPEAERALLRHIKSSQPALYDTMIEDGCEDCGKVDVFGSKKKKGPYVVTAARPDQHVLRVKPEFTRLVEDETAEVSTDIITAAERILAERTALPVSAGAGAFSEVEFTGGGDISAGQDTGGSLHECGAGCDHTPSKPSAPSGSISNEYYSGGGEMPLPRGSCSHAHAPGEACGHTHAGNRPKPAAFRNNRAAWAAVALGAAGAGACLLLAQEKKQQAGDSPVAPLDAQSWRERLMLAADTPASPSRSHIA